VESPPLWRRYDDGLWLSDQLIQSLFPDRAVALVISIDSVSRARRLSIGRIGNQQRHRVFC
jgi:hypothetical protein